MAVLAATTWWGFHLLTMVASITDSAVLFAVCLSQFILYAYTHWVSFCWFLFTNKLCLTMTTRQCLPAAFCTEITRCSDGLVNSFTAPFDLLANEAKKERAAMLKKNRAKKERAAMLKKNRVAFLLAHCRVDGLTSFGAFLTLPFFRFL